MLKKLILSSTLAISILLSAISFVDAGYSEPLPNASCNNGQLKIYIQASGSKERYAIRVDDTTNPWGGDKPNIGDIVINDHRSSEYSYKDPKSGVDYVWWIHKVDENGKYSEPKSGITYCGISKPTNLTAKYEYPNVVLTWDAVPGAKYYQVRVDNTSNPWNPVSMNEGDHMRNKLFTNSVSFKGRPRNLLVWWVHSVDERENATDASIHSFYVPVTTPLKKPTGLKATFNNSMMTISWNPVEGAKYYAVRVDDASTPWRSDQEKLYDGDHMRNEVHENSMTFRAASDKKYVWWVHAVDNNYVYTDAAIKETYTN